MPRFTPTRPLSSLLPYRSGGKLLFPLCRTCAEQRQSLEPDYQCLHSESERCLTETWVSTELHKVMDMGYRIERIYEKWHFPQTSDTLFKAYIDTFLKIKQEASGFPPECESEKEKRSYILDIFEREGIMFDPSQIEKNPVKRTIAPNCFKLSVGKIRSENLVTQISLFDRRRRITTVVTGLQSKGQRDRTLGKLGRSQLGHDFSQLPRETGISGRMSLR